MSFFLTCKCGASIEYAFNDGWETLICTECRRWGCWTLDEDQYDETETTTERK